MPVAVGDRLACRRCGTKRATSRPRLTLLPTMDTSPINDGGPAFPTPDAEPGFQCSYTGMTLRDWFAGQALQALVTSHQYGEELRRIFDADSAIANAGAVRETAQQYTGRIAYSLADGMIAARGKHP